MIRCTYFTTSFDTRSWFQLLYYVHPLKNWGRWTQFWFAHIWTNHASSCHMPPFAPLKELVMLLKPRCHIRLHFVGPVSQLSENGRVGNVCTGDSYCFGIVMVLEYPHFKRWLGWYSRNTWCKGLVYCRQSSDSVEQTDKWIQMASHSRG